MEMQCAEAMTAALAARHQSKSRPHSAPTAGANRTKSGKESMLLRCKNIEENMFRNLQMMREHRVATDDVRQRRKEQAEKTINELKQSCKSDHRTPSMLTTGEAVPELCRGSMKDRCAAMEAHLNQNEATMKGHRVILDGVHAARRAAQAAACGEESVETSSNCVHAIRDNSAWMGPALQAAATAKARHDSGNSSDNNGICVNKDTDCSDIAEGKSVAQIVAPPTAAQKVSLRPASAPVCPTQPKRPVSAVSTCLPQRPSSSLGGRMTKPQSGLTSWGGSRPVSAGSMKARCRALEENVRKNKEMMKANRESLDLVIKFRKEQAEKMGGLFA